MVRLMVILDIPVEPYWLDLPRGVRVEILPVSAALMAATQAGSARRLGALRPAFSRGTDARKREWK